MKRNIFLIAVGVLLLVYAGFAQASVFVGGNVTQANTQSFSWVETNNAQANSSATNITVLAVTITSDIQQTTQDSYHNVGNLNSPSHAISQTINEPIVLEIDNITINSTLSGTQSLIGSACLSLNGANASGAPNSTQYGISCIAISNMPAYSTGGARLVFNFTTVKLSANTNFTIKYNVTGASSADGITVWLNKTNNPYTNGRFWLNTSTIWDAYEPNTDLQFWVNGKDYFTTSPLISSANDSGSLDFAVFRDEFNGASLNLSKWNSRVGNAITNGVGTWQIGGRFIIGRNATAGTIVESVAGLNTSYGCVSASANGSNKRLEFGFAKAVLPYNFASAAYAKFSGNATGHLGCSWYDGLGSETVQTNSLMDASFHTLRFCYSPKKAECFYDGQLIATLTNATLGANITNLMLQMGNNADDAGATNVTFENVVLENILPSNAQINVLANGSGNYTYRTSSTDASENAIFIDAFAFNATQNAGATSYWNTATGAYVIYKFNAPSGWNFSTTGTLKAYCNSPAAGSCNVSVSSNGTDYVPIYSHQGAGTHASFDSLNSSNLLASPNLFVLANISTTNTLFLYGDNRPVFALSIELVNTSATSLHVLVSGSNTLTIAQSDNASNQANITFSRNEEVNPSVVVNAPANATWFPNGNVSLNVTPSAGTLALANVSLHANFSGSWASNATNSSPFNNSLTNFAVTGLADGAYLWSTRTVDSSSQWVQSQNRTVFVDSIAPASFANVSPTPANNSQFVQNYFFANFTFTETNPSSCWLSINGGANQSMTLVSGSPNYCSLNQTSQSTGNYSFQVYANDSANNWGVSDNRTVSLSPSAGTLQPLGIQLNSTAPVIGDSLLHSVLWESYSAENLSRWIFSSNYSGTWSNETSQAFTEANVSWSNYSKQSNATQNGTWGWRIYANDTFGQWNTTAIQTIALSNVSIATVNLWSPANNSELTFPVTFSYDVEGNNATYNCTYLFNGQNTTFANLSSNATNYSAQVTSGTGTYQLQVFCENTRGGNTFVQASAMAYFNATSAQSGGVGGGGGGGGGSFSTPTPVVIQVPSNESELVQSTQIAANFFEDSFNKINAYLDADFNGIPNSAIAIFACMFGFFAFLSPKESRNSLGIPTTIDQATTISSVFLFLALLIFAFKFAGTTFSVTG